MKLAMWTSWGVRCGIASYTAALVDALRPLGVEVSIVPVPYDDRRPKSLEAIRERLEAADMVHLQHEYTFFGGIMPGVSTLPWFLGRLRRPLVVTAHTVFTARQLLRVDQELRPRQRLAKRLLAAMPRYRRTVERDPFVSADGVIVHTEAARRQLQAIGLAVGRVHVIPGGAPPASPATPELTDLFRERLDLGGKRVVTIFGYVTPDKGYASAVSAIRQLPPAVKLVIAGGTRVEHERPFMDSLRSEIRRLGLENRVAITGYLDESDLAAVMALTDVVLAPHLTANGSYSLLVALSHGKAVLASNLPCFQELREAHACLETFPLGDDRALTERLGYLLASGGARRALGGAAAAYAARQTWSAVAERTAALYHAIHAPD